MSRYYTHYWTNETWREHEPKMPTLVHTASNQFDAIQRGDVVYVVTNIAGKLYLGARLEVTLVTDQRGAERYFGEPEWRAKTHLICEDEGLVQPMYYDRRVPDAVVQKLRFLSNGEPRSLMFRGDKLDQQTLRGVRELTPESATLLDGVLSRRPAATKNRDASEVLDEDYQGMEGQEQFALHRRLERDKHLVDLKKREARGDLSCRVCGFDFGRLYGKVGAGFIECHHLAPLAEAGPANKTLHDVELVCSNCHRMLHRRGRDGELVSIRTLRRIVDTAYKNM